MKAPIWRRALVVEGNCAHDPLFILSMAMFHWKCRVASNWQQAQRWLLRRRFNLLIVDYETSGGNGLDFIALARAAGIFTPALLISPDAPIFQFVQQDLFRIPIMLRRPFTFAQLEQALDQLDTLNFSIPRPQALGVFNRGLKLPPESYPTPG